MHPVSTLISVFVSIRFIPFKGVSFSSLERIKFSDNALPEGAAWPVHFNDPSGQYPKGQVCKGIFSPEETREKAASFFKLPLGHGTPHVTPGLRFGTSSPSQVNWTG